MLLPGNNISFYKQKFDCFLSSVRLKAGRLSKNLLTEIYTVSFHFNSAVKTKWNDHDERIKIFSSLEKSPEKKR